MAWGMSGKSSSPGYTAYGGEKLTQSLDQAEIDELRTSNPDMKEAFDVGLERVLGGKWPGEVDSDMAQTRLVFKVFFEKCRGLQMEVMRSIALGMGLQERFFDEFISEGDNTLRCLHYPRTKKEVFKKVGSVRAGAHSDYGMKILLALGRILMPARIDNAPISGCSRRSAGHFPRRHVC